MGRMSSLNCCLIAEIWVCFKDTHVTKVRKRKGKNPNPACLPLWREKSRLPASARKCLAGFTGMVALEKALWLRQAWGCFGEPRQHFNASAKAVRVTPQFNETSLFPSNESLLLPGLASPDGAASQPGEISEVDNLPAPLISALPGCEGVSWGGGLPWPHEGASFSGSAMQAEQLSLLP